LLEVLEVGDEDEEKWLEVGRKGSSQQQD